MIGPAPDRLPGMEWDIRSSQGKRNTRIPLSYHQDTPKMAESQSAPPKEQIRPRKPARSAEKVLPAACAPNGVSQRPQGAEPPYRDPGTAPLSAHHKTRNPMNSVSKRKSPPPGREGSGDRTKTAPFPFSLMGSNTSHLTNRSLKPEQGRDKIISANRELWRENR